ncbi:hypothetical protein SKAU_G00244040 [Synaphobranchus kaupii]|uniref:Uncharacterized protein n=1 Tax=Synaphobranchus kaupii TaxID=118154 RepID=A0A9Q1F1I9_SYNKA|nr:hypothetical protein SKAU_G00244040 [Synaphobranchus kaupii]
MSTKKHKAMGDGELMARLKKFATTGVWPSEAGNRPAPRQKRWHDLYQRQPTSGPPAAASASLPVAAPGQGPGTSRPPPPATPPGAMGDGAAEPAPSPRRSPLTLSMFSKPRFGGASGAAAKPNLVARKKPVEPHYGLWEDPASLQPHYGLWEDPAFLQSHYGLCENHSTATEVPRTDLY